MHTRTRYDRSGVTLGIAGKKCLDSFPEISGTHAVCVTAIARSILTAIVVHAVQYKWVVTCVVSAAILAQQRRKFLCAREQLELLGGAEILVSKMRDRDAGDSQGRG